MLSQYNIIVTAGANQALSSCMLALVDPEDSVCIFKPYYFNCLVSLAPLIKARLHTSQHCPGDKLFLRASLAAAMTCPAITVNQVAVSLPAAAKVTACCFKSTLA